MSDATEQVNIWIECGLFWRGDEEEESVDKDREMVPFRVKFTTVLAGLVAVL